MILIAAILVAGDPAGPVEHQRERVVEAIRNCPKAAAGEITVCARDRGFAERFRIQRLDPRFEKGGDGPTMGALAGVGKSGPGVCTTTGGASGTAGCSLRDYSAWGADKRERKAEGAWYPW